MDFGIARLAERRGAGASLTAAGAVIGSIEYMAPEQLMGEEVDLRVDVYATGCVLFECLAGQKVHNTTSIMGLVAKQSLKQAPDVTPLSGIPPQIVAVIGRALAPERNERWQTAAEMREALDAADAV
jgi:serine/threonine protein kinase